MTSGIKGLVLGLICSTVLTACMAIAPVGPVPAGKAQISGGHGIEIALAIDNTDPNFQTTIAVEPGDVKLLFLTVAPTGGALPGALAARHVKSCTLKVLADHQYTASVSTEQTFQAFWNRPVIVTDTTTGLVVAKVENNKEVK